MKGKVFLGSVSAACLSFTLLLLPFAAAAEGWTRIYQWESMDYLYPKSVVQTSDDGFAIATLCQARRVDNVGYQGHFISFDELQLMKINSKGEVLWKQAFTKIDDPSKVAPTVWITGDTYTIVETSDKGFAVAGNSYDAIWLFKVDGQGKGLWSRIYSLSDEASGQTWQCGLGAMIRTNDGGFALAGSAEAPGKSSDFWLLKVDSKGDMQWNQTFNSGTYKDGSGDENQRDDAAKCLVQTRDGGYALAGTASLFRASSSSMVYPSWMVKTDSQGRMVWNQGYDAPNSQWADYRIVQLADGGYVIAGSENQNIYLLKADSTGKQQWGKTLGSNYTGPAEGLTLLNDGGYAVAGSWNNDIGLLRLDSSGNTMWAKTYNARENATTKTKSDDSASDLVRTSDGGYAIVGSTVSSYENHQDLFLVKTETLEQPPQSTPVSTQTPSSTPRQTSSTSSPSSTSHTQSPDATSSSPTSSITGTPIPSNGGSSPSSAIPFETESPTQENPTAPVSGSPSSATIKPTDSQQKQSGIAEILPVAGAAVIIVIAVAAASVLRRRK